LQEGIDKVTIATLSGVPKYYNFRVRDNVHGKRVMALVDGGATHKFIDPTLLTKRQILVEVFEGFDVVVVDGYNMACT
jgi:hypothetical protein